MYCFAVVNSAVGANKNHLGVFNAAGSGKVFEVWRVEASPQMGAAVAGLKVTLTLARTTAPGVGTAAVVRKFDLTEDNLPAGVGGLHSYGTQPTVTTDSELAAAALNTEETVTAVGKIELFRAEPEYGIPPVTVRPGGGVVVRQGALAGAGNVNVFIYGRITGGG